MKLLLLLIPVMSIVAQAEDFSGNFMLKVKKNKSFYFCSGVAVSKTHLLTAAHCLDNAEEVQVHSDGVQLPIKKYEMHPNYKRKSSFYNFDIGVIELRNALSENIQIYQIANTKGKEPIIRVGFGGREGKNEITIIRGLQAEDFGNRFIKAKDSKSVSGDSGGALFQKEGDKLNLVAIHSTIEGGYSFNPSLSLADSWLKEKISK